MKLLVSVLSLALLSACATPDDPKARAEKEGEQSHTPQASIEAKQLAAENEATFVTEIDFVKGKSALTPAASKRIQEIVREARAKGKLDDVTVISWADREYPSVNSSELPAADTKLAKERGETISNFVKSQERGVDVDIHNMAERPNAMERLLSTSDARLKRSLETAGIPNTDTSVKSPSKASKAIVMITLED